jgi:hypothetical protein
LANLATALAAWILPEVAIWVSAPLSVIAQGCEWCLCCNPAAALVCVRCLQNSGNLRKEIRRAVDLLEPLQLSFIQPFTLSVSARGMCCNPKTAAVNW